MYEGRQDLGNIQPGDGARYHGRGFIQITGRANYRDYGEKLSLGSALEDNPDLALDPKISAKILACYFYDREIDKAANDGDWRRVRRLVNGGYNGWDKFNDYVQRALQKL
jgi:predicted chitinase